MSNKKNNKSAIIAVIILLVLVIGAIVTWLVLRPGAVDRHPQNAQAQESVNDAQSAEEETGETAAQAGETAAEPGQAESADGEMSEADLVTIAVSVKHADGSENEFTISTEALNLRGALEQENLIAGDESEYGLFVKTVDGETADDAKQEWWCFTKGGEMLMTGVDDTLIADGEHYEIVFTVGW